MKMGDDMKIEGAVDSISNLPDAILQHILCFIPTKISISTSLLSRRWRHVWCDVPSISLDVDTQTAASVNETLTRYTAPKTKSFHLTIKPFTENKPYIDRLIKFAMSHNVENLSLDFHYDEYKLPDFFFNSSSVKQLNIDLGFSAMIVPECTVSWPSLQKLSLSHSSLSDGSMANIISGSPVLVNLTIDHCDELNVLDLSKTLRLRTLEVQRSNMCQGPRQIVAPHIHCLRLYDSQLSCTLVDVSSLTEANLESSVSDCADSDYIQARMLKMLEKLHNVEKLKFGGKFIQVLINLRRPRPFGWILSLGEIGGVPFPMLKVKTLTLDTNISQYVIPGIERLLQNTPDLEKLICGRTSFQEPVEYYLKLQGFNVKESWRSSGPSWIEQCVDLESEHVASLVALVLKNTKKLEKLVLLLDERYLKFKIEDLTATLRHNNNVTIVLSSNNNTMVLQYQRGCEALGG